MIEIIGKYNAAKIYADALDSSAEGQIKKLLDQSFASGSAIRIMPDVHAGAGCAIGTSMTVTDKVVPNLVGVDIGCGMETVKLANTRVELPKLDSFIHASIPAGYDIRETVHKCADELRIHELRCKKQINLQRGLLSLATLGGGNHFIELDKDDEGSLYLIVHSGSRNPGLQVAQHYQDEAYKALGAQDEIPFELAYCEGDLLDDYLHDMAIMQEFAALNRKAIADEIIKGCKLKVDSQFSTIHNYIDLEHNILRKGAVSAQKGETLLIPINMRDGALVCEGLGNPDWNFSAPHGAGRLMSRSEAKQSFTLSAYKKEMSGVFSSTVNAETLDECPMAYKSIEDILVQIEQTARVVKHIHTIYNFKAGEEQSRGSKKRRIY
ncbi:MAG: RtcB family protein [Clostridiales bacterium]|jgi:RNA-splicing ligase RtcB|nr:RtcB family protein [Clostridiales bacterium]